MDYLEVIESNRAKFLRYNELKLQRFQQLIPSVNMRRALNALPCLLTVNSPKLPGYVKGEVPLGVCGYVPDEDTKRYIRGKYPGVRFDLVTKYPYVEMLAVMGSVGTVAYNKKSDFDYWVCVDMRRITAEQRALLKEKVEALRAWLTAEIEVPVHLFLNDVGSIKNNIFAEDEEERFGSTVGTVLKDEFYRSSIIIAGKIPFWWVIPSFVRDAEYEDLYASLPEEKRAEYLDFGNLFEISREDFLGAALFQIIKSLGNPFKSIIKIGVLEKYIFGKGDTPLLSQKIKMNIQRGNLENTIADSYLLMFKELYDYYSGALEDAGLMNILKQNLYLKVDPQISKYAGIKDKKNIPYKVSVMSAYVREWGWSLSDIRDLDNFNEWDYSKVMAFWDSVKKFMLLSYQKIGAHLPSLKLEKKISETDFMLLSRKIKTNFTREADKIDNFITFKDTPSESILYIEPVSRGIEEEEWRLFKRIKSEKDAFSTTTLRIEKNLVKLLVWMAVNQIYDPVFSRLNIQSGYSRINQTLVNELLNNITGLFSGERIRVRNNYFLSPAFNLVNMVIINFNRENLDSIQGIFHLYYTSWGESYLKEYSAEEDLARILLAVVRGGLVLRKNFDGYCIVNTPEPFKKLYKRISAVFREAYGFLVEGGSSGDARFVASLGDKFIMVSREGGEVTAHIYPSLARILAALTMRPREQVRYFFSGEEGPLTTLALVYGAMQRNSATVVYEENRDPMTVYVMNEKGNLFVFMKSQRKKDLTLIHCYEFCKNALKRVNEKSGGAQVDSQRVKFYGLKTDKMGKVTLTDETRVVEDKYLRHTRSSPALVASVSRHMAEESFYNVLFPDNVSSGFMSIKELGSVMEKMKELRVSGVPVSGIFRDLFFTDLLDEDLRWGSTLYFLEKYKLELLVDRA